jgi:hypothetical protein
MELSFGMGVLDMNKWARRGLIALGVFVALGIIGNLVAPPDDEAAVTASTIEVATTVEPVTTTTEPAPATTTEQATTTTEQATTVPESQFTRSEENAIRSAEEYLDFLAFSRSGLIEQLEFEGFTTEQATYGVDKTGL